MNQTIPIFQPVQKVETWKIAKPETRRARMIAGPDIVEKLKTVGPALMEELAREFPPHEIAAKIRLLLDHRTKNGIPDIRAVEAGLKFLLSYLIGTPVQRQEIVQVNVSDVRQLREQVASSPALQSALAKLIGQTAQQAIPSGTGEPGAEE